MIIKQFVWQHNSFRVMHLSAETRMCVFSLDFDFVFSFFTVIFVQCRELASAVQNFSVAAFNAKPMTSWYTSGSYMFPPKRATMVMTGCQVRLLTHYKLVAISYFSRSRCQLGTHVPAWVCSTAPSLITSLKMCRNNAYQIFRKAWRCQ